MLLYLGGSVPYNMMLVRHRKEIQRLGTQKEWQVLSQEYKEHFFIRAEVKIIPLIFLY